MVKIKSNRVLVMPKHLIHADSNTRTLEIGLEQQSAEQHEQ